MKDVYKLYIDNKLVDIPQDFEFPINYTVDDLTNPTAVKNEYSKSITIDGTDNNNKIFGEIYNLDREQLYSINSFTGANFNPTKRTPFILYRNGEINQSGYIQLNDITIVNKTVKYTFTLYGGLGDFFYSLMNDNEGNKLTLADLRYNIEDENGNVLPSDKEMDITISKELVNRCFDNAGLDGNKFENVISFIPSYNGNYDDFDTNTVLINTTNSSAFPISSVTENNITYKPYEGYVLAKLDKNYNEWEMRDLRSYMQRPAIRVKKLVEAICNPINNGGYNVELSETFFNDGNPYYSKAYIVLPLLTSLKESTSTDVKESTLITDVNNSWVGEKDGIIRTQQAVPIDLTGGTITTTDYNNVKIIDMSNIEVDAKLSLAMAFQLQFTPNTLPQIVTSNDELYLTYHWQEYNTKTFRVTNYAKYKSILIQAYLQDADTYENLWQSEVLNFSNAITIDDKLLFSTPRFWQNYTPLQGNMKNMNGRFVKSGDKYIFKHYNANESTFQINIDEVPRRSRLKLSYIVKVVASDFQSTVTPMSLYSKDYVFVQDGKDWTTKATFDINKYISKGYFTTPLNSNASKLRALREEATLKSGTQFTKQQFLKTEFSPADFLLDYTKLFGLMYIKDINEKTIKIISRNTYYTDNVINLNDKIDWGKEVKITPTLIETKYLTMSYKEGKTQFDEKYKTDYNVNFGQKRVDTSYNFNVESKNMYEGTNFDNAVTILDSSPYYRRFKNKNGKEVPVWVLDNPKISLYNNELESIEIETYNASIVNLKSITQYNAIDGYDVFPKLCCFKQDSNGKALEDISTTLVFFNGLVETKDANGNELPYWISDDVYQMMDLNEGVCYLYTEQEQDYNFNNIAIKRTTLPQFTRYCFNNNVITDSFDFGQPKENYIPNVYYDESSTLYERFWKNYLFDKYDVNTKLLTCYVNLTDMVVTNEFARNLFYFNNAYWVIHSIENYLPNNYQTTKVQFVKVNNITNYSNGQLDFFYPNVTLSDYKLNVEYNSTANTITLTSNNDWQGTVTSNEGTINPTSGEVGTYEIDIRYPINNTNNEKVYTYKFFVENYGSKTLTVTQPPNPNTTILLTGYVYYEYKATPIVNAKLICGDAVAYTDFNGYYKMYLPKGQQLDVEVYINDELQLVQFISTSVSQEKNFIIED